VTVTTELRNSTENIDFHRFMHNSSRFVREWNLTPHATHFGAAYFRHKLSTIKRKYTQKNPMTNRPCLRKGRNWTNKC